MPSAITAHRASPEIEQAVAAHQAALNNSRYIPETPEIFRQAAEKAKLYIFNVGPWSLRRELGSAGTYFIPACPDGQEYAKGPEVLGVVEEPYPINEAECKMIQDSGESRAAAILGTGPFMPPNSSFVKFGAFISKTPIPTKDELAAARKSLRENHLAMVKEAGEAWALGPNVARQIIDPQWHFVAARALKKTETECPWLTNSELPAERENCPSCGTVYKTGIMKCGVCNFILDKARYDDAMKKGLFAA